MATTPSNASSEGSYDLFWPLGALAHSAEHTDKQVHIHKHKQVRTVSMTRDVRHILETWRTAQRWQWVENLQRFEKQMRRVGLYHRRPRRQLDENATGNVYNETTSGSSWGCPEQTQFACRAYHKKKGFLLLKI